MYEAEESLLCWLLVGFWEGGGGGGGFVGGTILDIGLVCEDLLDEGIGDCRIALGCFVWLH